MQGRPDGRPMNNGVESVAQTRDLRLDLFRGLANWAIFLDHVPNNVVAWITIRNYGFSDAAELFVFVSGFTVAFVYQRILQAKGVVAATVGLIGRVWQIYVAYLLLFLVYVVAIGYVAQRYGHAHLLDEFNIRQLIAEPIEFLKHGMLLEYRPLNLDVLPLYIVLMAAFPPALLILTKSPNVLLVASAGLYVVARAQGWNLPGYPSGTWYFNPFAWQFLFAIGAWSALGDRQRLDRILRSPIVTFAAIVVLTFSAAVTLAVHMGLGESLPNTIRTSFLPNDKTNLAPYRIVHFLALAIIVWVAIPKEIPALRWKIFRPLIICGRHSLEVFCAGVFLAFVAYFAIDLVSESVVFQFVVSIVGISAMTGVAYFREWIKGSKAADAKMKKQSELSPAIVQRD